MIRLRRVGIDPRQISAVFPRRLMPNAVACWLKIGLHSSLQTGSLLAAGPLGALAAGSCAGVAELVARAGFAPRIAAAVERRLQLGDTLVCVHAGKEPEVALAWHIFRHSRAEVILVGDSGPAALALNRIETAFAGESWSAAA